MGSTVRGIIIGACLAGGFSLLSAIVQIIAGERRENHNQDHERKLRNMDYRRQVYVNFTTAAGELRHVKDVKDANRVLDELGVALATMRIVSTDAVITAADDYYGRARMRIKSKYDSTDADRIAVAAQEDAGWFHRSLTEFIEAARREDQKGG